MNRHLKNAFVWMVVCCVAWMRCAPQPAENERVLAEVRVLAVGQGLCVLVRDTAGDWLVDAGGDSSVSWSALMRDQGVSALRGVVLSHWHLDHVGGVFSLLREFHMDSLWYGPDSGNAGLRDSVLRLAALRGVATRLVMAPFEWRWGELAVQALWPWPDRLPAEQDNARSLVLRMGRAGEGWVLLPGDIGVAEESSLLESGVALESDYLIVPHHGSAGSSSVPFIAAVNPYRAIVSVGENPWGLPREEIVSRYEQTLLGAPPRLRRTDRTGSVRLRLYLGFGWAEDTP